MADGHRCIAGILTEKRVKNMYKCMKCGKQFDNIEFIRCPYCGSKVFFKTTPPIARKLKAV